MTEQIGFSQGSSSINVQFCNNFDHYLIRMVFVHVVSQTDVSIFDSSVVLTPSPGFKNYKPFPTKKLTETLLSN